MLAIVAPGQGAQTPGFLSAWIEDPSAKARLQQWSDAIGIDLVRLGTSADADEIRETSFAQPLLVAAGLLSYNQLGNPKADFIAGHSVGEITAAGISGVLSADDAMKLVSVRGKAMSEAATGTNTGMAACLGGEREAVVAHLASLGLTPANENGGGQIVAAGPLAKLEELKANPPEKVRIIPLQVSGAFHTSVMAPAVAALEALIPSLSLGTPTIPSISNKDGAIVNDAKENLARIVGQVAGPVRWDLCMDTFATKGVTGVLEVAPGGTLAGLVKRAHPSIAQFALKSPEDLENARAFIAEHGGK